MNENQTGFILKQLYFDNKNEKKYFDITFFNAEDIRNAQTHNTILIGKNSTGKSFILETVASIFISVEKAIRDNFSNKYTLNIEGFEVDARVIYYIYDKEVIICISQGLLSIKVDGNNITPSMNITELLPKVLACSFIAHDRFPYIKNYSTKYDYLGIRQAQKSSNRTYTSSIDAIISDAILDIKTQDDLRLIYDILESIGYDRHLVFRWDVKLKRSFKSNNKEYKENIRNLIYEAQSNSTDLDKEKIAHNDYLGKYKEIKFEKNYYDELEKLYNDKFTITPNLFLSKNNKTYDLKMVSSGEKQLLFSFIQLIARCEDNNLILIDEPESSLHPDVQMKYISLINKLFEYKRCHFIFATHSHFLVSDLKPELSSIIILDKISGEYINRMVKNDTYGWSAENILYEVFGLRTSRNYYFEKDMESFLEAIANDDFEKADILKNKLSVYTLSDNDPLKKILEANKDDIIGKQD